MTNECKVNFILVQNPNVRRVQIQNQNNRSGQQVYILAPTSSQNGIEKFKLANADNVKVIKGTFLLNFLKQKSKFERGHFLGSKKI